MGIIAILDSAGAVVVKYVYDSWGNHDVTLLEQVYESQKSTHIGYLNSFRYRGYYYDTETKLYYLKTRYYDPIVGRFITIDDLSYIDPEHINGLNLYAYCGNNPVMNTDTEGTGFWSWLWNSTVGKIVATIVIAVAVIALTVVTAGIGTAITGALGGGLAASIIGGAVGGAISGAIFGAGLSIISQGISNGYANINWKQVGIDTLVGMGVGAVSGAAFAVAGRALGFLGKTSWAQRPVDFSKSANAFFGSKSGNFTFLRIGKSFRLEASIQHGMHIHYQTIKNGLIVIGRSVPRTNLVNAIWNSLVGLAFSGIRQLNK